MKRWFKIKIAIISDVHGNCVALKRVLEDAEKSGAEEYVFLGDLVNDFPMGNETLELVKSKTENVLRGNKEQYLIELEQKVCGYYFLFFYHLSLNEIYLQGN